MSHTSENSENYVDYEQWELLKKEYQGKQWQFKEKILEKFVNSIKLNEVMTKQKNKAIFIFD